MPVWKCVPSAAGSSSVSSDCQAGCATCSALNGCLSCKPRFFFHLELDGMRQRGTCLSSCPRGHYGTRSPQISTCTSTYQWTRAGALGFIVVGCHRSFPLFFRRSFWEKIESKKIIDKKKTQLDFWCTRSIYSQLWRLFCSVSCWKNKTMCKF